ncbi:MAG: GTPase Era [Bacteroidales bacterium]|jgi:GTP-binding protein Era|nr:GTPase Era [Bacteroidales bacterium]MDD3329756.1 GTPase Era [Bacteroidales bacterium]MDD3690633.1 GTPase Era [Bacteroidales bacterium]MDD4045038.1 GTPase Era [Bacteroidales bacterium]NLO42398.1 GTPase Era [Bacteroidales bacterium]
MEHKAGYVSIVGNPNVGKSTLMNALIGQHLSIITSKAQTTRHRIMGIVNGEDYQIVYSDTPGLLNPAYKMQEYMMRYIETALQDSDLLLYVVEVKETKHNEKVIQKLKDIHIPLFLIINKIDAATQEQIQSSRLHWEEMLNPQKTFCVSALKQEGLDDLMLAIVEQLPACPPYFPKDELTDRPMRFFVSEIIREKILLFYQKEIPYSVEVEITAYKEKKEITFIDAIIYVERETQKGILLGHKGQAIKTLGTEARLAVENFIGRKAYLSLSIKVQKDWRNNESRLQHFGYGV